MKRLWTSVLFFVSFFLVSTASFAQPALDELNLRTKSARLDTLQLNVGIEDETNVVGLDFWGGNPAGLVLDEKKSRVVPVFERATLDDRIDGTDSHNTKPGLYGVAKSENQAIGAQLNYQSFKDDDDNEDDTQTFAEIIYSRKFSSNLLLGLNAGFLSERDETDSSGETKFKSDPAKLGGGIGYLIPIEEGNLILGANIESNDIKEEPEGADDVDNKETAYNSTLIYQSPKLIDLGVGFSRQNLEIGNVEADTNLFAGRVFLKPEQSFWRAGIEYFVAKTDYDPTELESTVSALNIGLTWLFGERGLLGINFGQANTELDDSVDKLKDTINLFTIGGELNFSDQVSGRLSFGDGKVTDDSDITSIPGLTFDSTFIRTLGVGLGIKLSENGKLDIGYIQEREKDADATSVDDKAETLEMVATLYF